MSTRQNSGITLTELMIATTIMAFVILPIFGLLNYTNRGTREQDAEGIAANLAKEEMNRLMFIISRENLLSGAGAPLEWSFGADYDIKGNKFSGEYTVYPFSNTELAFSIPKFVFHDPMNCSSGLETTPGTTLGTAQPMTIAEVYPDSAGLCRLADIKLVVKWRLPSGEYNEISQFELLARRAFLVKE
ncbi:MAG: prepilin-type N-terminal cleavage/methylation domain-containing protein [Candidatus Riflebacteria bacterium]|nr:prepilin-type N-terminal cleavage/methylation domain-containing protein [Candidatus Riflebacteria bacterium]